MIADTGAVFWVTQRGIGEFDELLVTPLALVMRVPHVIAASNSIGTGVDGLGVQKGTLAVAFSCDSQN